MPLVPQFREEFQARHRRLYGHAFPHREVEAVVLRLQVMGPEPQSALPRLQPVASRAISLPREGSVWLPQGPATMPFYYRPELAPGEVLSGPALLLEDHATLLVLPGFKAEVLAQGHVLLHRN